MPFLKRLGYYLVGFAIGLVFLVFFFRGKRTSCNYGPNARVIKALNSKALNQKKFLKDSASIQVILRYGNVIFSKSNVQLDSCKMYYIEGATKETKNNFIKVKNCDSLVTVLDFGTINKTP